MTISRLPFFKACSFYTFLLLTSLFFTAVQAQVKTEFLSLDDALRTVEQNNDAVQSARADEAIAQEKLKQTNAGFLPKLSFSYTALATDNPLNVFGFKLQQSAVTAADFNPGTLNHPNTTTDVTTKIELLQPLLNLDAFYLRKSAQQQVESVRYQTQRTKEHLALETQKAYYRLQMAHQAVKVLQEALATAKSMYEFTGHRVVQGLIQKSDLLNTEVQVLGTESSLNEAKANVLNASDYLGVLMNKPGGVVYQTEIPEQVTLQSDSLSVLPRNRSDFLAIENAIAATNWMMKSSKRNHLPRLNAVGAYQFNDSKLAGFNAGSYLAGIRFSWNIFDGNLTKLKVRTLKWEQDKLELQLHTVQKESQMLLDKGSRDLANAAYKIKQYNAAVVHADEALRILRNRYEEGLVNTTDVLTAQTQLAQQKLLLAQAILDYNTTRANIEFLTSTHLINQH